MLIGWYWAYAAQYQPISLLESEIENWFYNLNPMGQ